jgi:hypothetical protein
MSRTVQDCTGQHLSISDSPGPAPTSSEEQRLSGPRDRTGHGGGNGEAHGEAHGEGNDEGAC